MRTSAVLKVASGALALSGLLFIVPNHASASNYCGLGDDYEDTQCTIATYNSKGYAYDEFSGSSAPMAGAVLVHVKTRHEHFVEFTSYGPSGALVDDFAAREGIDENWNGINGWFDPAKVARVKVTLGSSTISANTDGDHCYYEDKHGNLQPAIDRPCNSL
ncbi:MAG: hypothetical protein JO362_16650 [Streptomycetaceae bacterium]|nr:hypothetical protein [Streptomycetaceae bacterium]